MTKTSQVLKTCEVSLCCFMDEPRLTARHGKLIAALTASDMALLAEIEQELTQRFSPIDATSDLFSFDAFTSYYQPEMGTELQKCFVSFRDIILVETLPEIKLLTNEIEQRCAVNGNRRINIDPGYLTAAHMVLATTKPYTHRIYLGQGIHAELTYICKKRVFHTLEWTYFDYRAPLAMRFFEGVRKTLLKQMRDANLRI